MKKITILVVIALFLSGCGKSFSPLPEVNEISDELQGVTIDDFYALETEQSEYWNNQYQYDDLSFEQVLSLRRLIDGGHVTLVEMNETEISTETNTRLSSSLEIVIPVITLTPAALKSLAVYAPEIEAQMARNVDLAWLWIFHWTNHANELGFSQYALSQAGALASNVVRGALSGNGDIIYYQATANMEAKYLFVSQINGRYIATVLSEAGRPVTMFRSQASYVLRQVEKLGGVRISRDGVSPNILQNWENGTPPVLRYWWWALSYNAKMIGVSVAAFITTNVVDFVWGIFIVPPCMFDNTCLFGQIDA